MNKFFIIAIALILGMQSVAAQDIKAKVLSKRHAIECTYQGMYMELDSIYYEGEKMYY